MPVPQLRVRMTYFDGERTSTRAISLAQALAQARDLALDTEITNTTLFDGRSIESMLSEVVKIGARHVTIEVPSKDRRYDVRTGFGTTARIYVSDETYRALRTIEACALTALGL